MLGLRLRHLSAGEVEDFFTQQCKDDHVVLAEALVRLARADDVRDEGFPVFRPLSFQNLKTSMI